MVWIKYRWTCNHLVTDDGRPPGTDWSRHHGNWWEMLCWGGKGCRNADHLLLGGGLLQTYLGLWLKVAFKIYIYCNSGGESTGTLMHPQGSGGGGRWQSGKKLPLCRSWQPRSRTRPKADQMDLVEWGWNKALTSQVEKTTEHTNTHLNFRLSLCEFTPSLETLKKGGDKSRHQRLPTPHHLSKLGTKWENQPLVWDSLLKVINLMIIS